MSRHVDAIEALDVGAQSSPEPAYDVAREWCWRCEAVVSADDDLGLCVSCAEYLKAERPATVDGEDFLVVDADGFLRPPFRPPVHSPWVHSGTRDDDLIDAARFLGHSWRHEAGTVIFDDLPGPAPDPARRSQLSERLRAAVADGHVAFAGSPSHTDLFAELLAATPSPVRVDEDGTVSGYIAGGAAADLVTHLESSVDRYRHRDVPLLDPPWMTLAQARARSLLRIAEGLDIPPEVVADIAVDVIYGAPRERHGTLEIGVYHDSVLNTTNDLHIFAEEFSSVVAVGMESWRGRVVGDQFVVTYESDVVPPPVSAPPGGVAWVDSPEAALIAADHEGLVATFEWMAGLRG